MANLQVSRRQLLGTALAAGGAVGSGGLLSACSSSAGSGSGSDKPVGKNPSGSLSLVSWGAATDHASVKKLVDSYMKAFPKVNVKFTTGDCGVDIGACKKLIAGGTMTDILIPHNSQIELYADSGILTDLSPLIKRDKVDLTQFVSSALKAEMNRRDDRYYALPMGYHVETLYYNKSMFDKAGLAYPPADGNYTYQDLRKWALKLTLDKNGKTPTDPGFDPNSISQWGFYTWPMNDNGYDPILLAWGGSIVSPTDTKKCTMDDPATVQAFQFIQDLIWKDHVAMTPQEDQAQAGKYRFAAGHVAMLSGAHWMTDIMIAQAPHVAYDVAPLPKGPKGHASILNVHGWSIYKSSKNTELAWHFVKWVSTTGAGPAMGLIPAYKPIVKPDFLQAPHQPAHLKEAFIVPASWPTTVSPPEFGPNFAELMGQDGISSQLTDIYFDKKSAAAALASACSRVTSIQNS